MSFCVNPFSALIVNNGIFEQKKHFKTDEGNIITPLLNNDLQTLQK